MPRQSKELQPSLFEDEAPRVWHSEWSAHRKKLEASDRDTSHKRLRYGASLTGSPGVSQRPRAYCVLTPQMMASSASFLIR
jgi:hypothetical protein